MQVRAMPQDEHPLYPAPAQPRVGLKPSYLRSFMLTSSGRLRLASRGVITCEPGSPAPGGPKGSRRRDGSGTRAARRPLLGSRAARALPSEPEAHHPYQRRTTPTRGPPPLLEANHPYQRPTTPTRGPPSLPEASLEPTAGRAGLLRARPRLVHAGARPSWMSLTCAARTSRYRLARAISSSLSRRRSSFSCFACAWGQAWG